MEAGQREIARRSAILPILVVYLAVRAFWLALDQGGRVFDSILASGCLKIGLWILPCVALTMALNRLSPGAALRELGLGRGLRAGLAFGALAALPMAVAILFAGLQVPGLAEIVATSVVDPIAESVLFSGFLFSQLRRAQWRVATALVVSALMFSLAHMDGAEFALAGYAYRALLGLGADMLWHQLRLFVPGLLAVAAGGLLFTWLFHRWRSLWPAIALHAAINFWWTVSGERGMVDRWSGAAMTATGVAHAIAMTIAIVATLRWTRRGPSRFSALRST